MFENLAELKNSKLLNPLVLAYVGDAVYEVYVRMHILGDGAEKTNILHKRATGWVSAVAQADILEKLQDKLTDEEKDIVRRGRNASVNTIPKNANIAEYKKATAFEALIGYLFLSKNNKRLEEIIGFVLEA